MKYDAITIDTSIFGKNSWNLEGGMLGQLGQFKEGSIQLVLSEIVVRELRKYLKLEAEKARDAVDKARRESRKSGLFTAETFEELEDLFEKAISSDEAAEKRIEIFVDSTGMVVIPAIHTEINELIQRYFGSSAPFEKSGKKKSEFPDAIALLSMEKWAEKEGKKILAISNDNGWVDFGRGSKWIDAEKNLANPM